MKKILLIDDETDFCYFTRKNLERSGEFEVVVRNDAESGIKTAIEQKPDLILLDIIMPQLDGTEAAFRLLNDERTKDIPIIFLTCLAEEKALSRNYNHSLIGKRPFVSKPCQAPELIKVIRETLAVLLLFIFGISFAGFAQEVTKKEKIINKQLLQMEEKLGKEKKIKDKNSKTNLAKKQKIIEREIKRLEKRTDAVSPKDKKHMINFLYKQGVYFYKKRNFSEAQKSFIGVLELDSGHTKARDYLNIYIPKAQKKN